MYCESEDQNVITTSDETQCSTFP